MAEYRGSIEIAAPPETVFDYLTTDAGMTAWMGQFAALDPRPGGTFAVDVAGYPIRGSYLTVERPVLVVVSWGVAGSDDLPAGASTVEFRLTAVGGGTRVDLTHTGLPDAAKPGYSDGWRHFLSRLRIAAPGGDPGRDGWRPLDDRTHRRPDRSETTDPADIVRAYHRAWTGGDIDRAMTLVADDITCRAPGGDLTGKAAYRELLAGFAPTLVGLADIADFAAGDRVALFYYPQTAVTGTAPVAECFTVRDGKIAESVLVFDRLAFAPPTPA